MNRGDRIIFRADKLSQTHRASIVNRGQEGGKHGVTARCLNRGVRAWQLDERKRQLTDYYRITANWS